MRENQSLRELFEGSTDCEWSDLEVRASGLNDTIHSVARTNGEAAEGAARYRTVNCECAGAVQYTGGKRSSAVPLTSF